MRRKLLSMAFFLGLISTATLGQIGTPPVIDGDPSDAVWATAETWELLRPNNHVEGFITGPDDFSGMIKVLWDADNMYCLLEVKDDVWDIESNQPWERDHWSIYFDLSNLKTNGAHTKDQVLPLDSVQFMLERRWLEDSADIVKPLGIDTLTVAYGTDYVEVATGTGYILEIAVPLSSVGVAISDQAVVGFDAKIGDNDSDGQLDGKWSLYQTADEGWRNMSYIGTAKTETDGSMSRVEAPPVIDGMWDPSWYNAMEYDLEVKNQFTEEFWDGPADFDGSFHVMHDLKNIYVLLEVQDDVWDIESNQPWERDHWSVYFDISNIKQNGPHTKDAVLPLDSIQFMVERRWKQDSADYVQALGIDTLTLAYDTDYVETVTETGYLLEMVVPFSSLGVTLTEGMVIGYDTKIGDNDGDGQLDHKLAWHQSADEGWRNAAYMGNMELEPVFFDLGGMSAATVEPVIDGEKDGMWAQANTFQLERKNLWLDEFVSGPDDFSGQVSVLWNPENVFVLLEVKDDVWDIVSNQPWERDHWSIYFDVSNIKQDGDHLKDQALPLDSVQFMMERNWKQDSADIVEPLGIDTLTMSYFTDYVETVTEDGYLLEVVVPFSRIGLELSEGMTIGWDAKIGDNDGDGQLDAKLSWNQLMDEGWRNMMYLGNVELMGNGTIEGTPATTTFDIVEGSADHTLLEAALVAAELDGALSTMDTLTVFAPVDAAFEGLPEGLLDQLLADPSGDLTSILQYHVVPGMVLSTDLSDGMTATTLLGQDITVSIVDDTVVKINEATVIVADLEADNGVVHVLDGILLPATGMEEEVAAAKVAMYPNPATNLFNLISNTEIASVTVTSITGQLVKDVSVQSRTAEVDISDLQTGMYLITVRSATGDVTNKMLMKQ